MISIPRDLKHSFYTYHSKYTKTIHQFMRKAQVVRVSESHTR